MFALALLAACDPDRPKPVDDTGPEDTAGADDTGLPEPWAAPEVGCELSRPLPVADVANLSDLHGPYYLSFFVFSSWFTHYEHEFGCPTSERDEAAGATRWMGDCDLETFAWRGTWTEYFLDGVEGHVIDDVELRDDALGARLAMDGSVRGWGSLAEGAFLEHAFRWDVAGFTEHWGNDERWRVDSLESLTEGVSYSFDLRADARTATLDGDYCLFQESYPYDGCDAEPWGGWVLEGDGRLVVTWDPHVACDGCGAVTLDGVSIGEVCGSDYGAWVP